MKLGVGDILQAAGPDYPLSPPHPLPHVVTLPQGTLKSLGSRSIPAFKLLTQEHLSRWEAMLFT